MTVPPTQAWTLERNDRRLHFASGPAATMFAESGAFRVRPHRHPAWKIVLALGGGVEVGYDGNRTLTAAGVIVPPQLAHTCAVSSAYVALFLDPWELALGTDPTRLNETAAHRMLAALDHPGRGADLDAARAELAALAGAGAPLDSRVAHAVREITRPGSTATIGAVAAQVGLSQPRLRTLVRDWVGIPLPRLRLWAKLRTAMTELPAESAAAAAAFAGFADQAHLTRTARTLAGRTPSEILRPGASGTPA
ncbi:helix-turn-helix domain-containing protein [Streptomyces sasae]|uniref:helix-turn-helix domain-containing protein n=1 Tax=Streptomyces sasae TaxID=1266772 RepID=UPI00292E09D1|nr:helix-turn-helix domain-containing protein [Streptomyces sasae]